MGPIDYSSNISNPTQSFMQGLQGGAAVNQLQQQQDQQDAAKAQQLQMRQDLSALSKNPTSDQIIAMSVKYPQLSEQFKRSYDMLAPQEQEAKVNAMLPVYSAAVNGRGDIASQLLNEQADALENSGQKQQADAVRAHAQAFLDHPETMTTTSGLLLASAMGPEKFKSLIGGLTDQAKAPSEVAQSKAEAGIKGAQAANAPIFENLKNADISSQITTRAGQLQLDRDKLDQATMLALAELKNKIGTLPEYVAKDVSTAVTESVAADQSADKMLELASRIDASKDEMSTGFIGASDEAIKKFRGVQNEVTQIRNDYNRIVTPAAMAAYKEVASGSTSDKDIDVAMTGIPKDTADPALMSSYLKGVAKLQVLNSIQNNAKSEWLSEVKYLGKTKTDTVIDGVNVPKGTTFAQFTKQYLPQKVKDTFAAKNIPYTDKAGYQQSVGSSSDVPGSNIPANPTQGSGGWSITPIGGQ